MLTLQLNLAVDALVDASPGDIARAYLKARDRAHTGHDPQRRQAWRDVMTLLRQSLPAHVFERALKLTKARDTLNDEWRLKAK